MTSVLIVEDQRMPRENMEHLVEDSGRYRRVTSLSTAKWRWPSAPGTPWIWC